MSFLVSIEKQVRRHWDMWVCTRGLDDKASVHLSADSCKATEGKLKSPAKDHSIFLSRLPFRTSTNQQPKHFWLHQGGERTDSSFSPAFLFLLTPPRSATKEVEITLQAEAPLHLGWDRPFPPPLRIWEDRVYVKHLLWNCSPLCESE